MSHGAGPRYRVRPRSMGRSRSLRWAASAATRLATQRGDTAGDGGPTRTRKGVRIWPPARTGGESGGAAVIGAAGLGDWGSRVQISPSRPTEPGAVVYAPGMSDTNRSQPHPKPGPDAPEQGPVVPRPPEPDAPEPHPPASGPPDTPEPHPLIPGPPNREGSPGPETVAPDVHTPPGMPTPPRGRNRGRRRSTPRPNRGRRLSPLLRRGPRDPGSGCPRPSGRCRTRSLWSGCC